MRTVLQQLWTLMGRHRTTYLLAGVSLIIATLFQLIFPWLLRRAIDVVETGSKWAQHLFWFCLVLLLIAIGEAIFTYLKGRLTAKATQGIACDLRTTLFDHLLMLPVSGHNEMQTGDIIQRATSDVQTIERFLGNQVVEVFRTFCLLMGVSGFMLVMQPGLALYAIALLPPIFLFSLAFFPKIQKQFESLDEAEAEVSSKLQEFLTGIRVVKAFGREAHERAQFEKFNETMMHRDYTLSKLHGIFWSLSDSMCLLQVVVVLLVGGIKAIHGDISLGTFVAFNTYVAYLVWPVRHIGRLLGEMGHVSVSLKRIRQILSAPVENLEIESQREWQRFDGHVVFENVQFSYNGARVLEDVSFSVRPGETIAILGPTGSGKTTLMHLLMRFYDSYEGRILIDGVELRTIPRSVVRTQIGLVMQEPFLFSQTLYQNIAFGRPEAAENEVATVAQIASLDQAIHEFHDGYKTMIGERGITLSGGQKQRVALARTLLVNPSILILDDTTSALDTETEAQVCAAIRRQKAGRTLFIVTHRLNTAAGADYILVVENGRISQAGTHDELLQLPGFYRRIHEEQWARESNLRKELHHANRTLQRNRQQKTI